jgi:RNA recognition motif-containing protein
MKLYAGNLATTTTESDLRAAFAPHGTVDNCHLATDKESGKTKGFGYVEMRKDEEAQAAITALNGSELAGNTIRVNESTPKAQASAVAAAPKA